MSSQLHLIDFPKVNSHIHFVDDVQELAKEQKEEKGDEELKEKINIPEVEDIVEMTIQKKKTYKKLDEQISKAKNFGKIFDTLTMQKHLMVFML